MNNPFLWRREWATECTTVHPYVNAHYHFDFQQRGLQGSMHYISNSSCRLLVGLVLESLDLRWALIPSLIIASKLLSQPWTLCGSGVKSP